MRVPTRMREILGPWNPYNSVVICRMSGYGYLPAQPPPVLISTGFISPPVVGRAIINLLSKHDWTTTYAVVDESSVSVYTGFMKSMELEKPTKRIQFYQRHILASKMESFRNLLNEFRMLSRGTFGPFNPTTERCLHGWYWRYFKIIIR